MECNFCKSILKTLSSLNYHKKSNKKCLELQNRTVENVKSSLVMCNFCNIKFTNIKTHLLSCKIKKNEYFENLQEEFKKLQKENKKLKKKYQKKILE